MEGMFHRDDLMIGAAVLVPGVFSCCFDGSFDGLGSAVGEKYLIHPGCLKKFLTGLDGRNVIKIIGNVKEFFRVRHRPDVPKTYLLDYDITMDQIFDPMKHVLNEKGVLLGIVPHDIPYMVNKDGSAVSFVVANELWNYNKGTDQISLVFSFSDAENTDVRNLTAQHEVKLLEVDDTGNTTFAVY